MKKPLYVAKKRFYCSLRLWLVASIIIMAIVCVKFYFMFGGLSHILKCKNHLIKYLVHFIFEIILIGWQTVLAVRLKSYRLKIYDGRIVESWGLVWGRREDQYLFLGIKDIHVNRGFFGTMLDFGRVVVELPGDCPEKFEIDVDDIAEPESLRHFLESHFVATEDSNIIVGL